MSNNPPRIYKYLLIVTLVSLTVGCTLQTEPPIVVSVRESHLDRGKVLRITNTMFFSVHQVQVIVAANPKYRFPEVTAVVADSLASNYTVEVGWRELGGRELVPGDTVSVTANNYGSVTITVPKLTAPRQAAK